MSVSRKSAIRWAILATLFAASYAIAIALFVWSCKRGDLGMTIRGRVVDRQSGLPIRDAVVLGTSGAPLQFILTRDQARTNQYGIFELKISPTRPTQMRVDAQRYFPTGYYVDPMQPAFVELKMTRSMPG